MSREPERGPLLPTAGRRATGPWLVACPTCSRGKESWCRSRSGRDVYYPHAARVLAWQQVHTVEQG